MKVGIKKLHPNAVVPKYAKSGDAGLDLTAVEIINDEGFQVTYKTGLAFEIPLGYVGLLFPRSSIRNYQLSLSNAVGVIDCVPAGTKIKTIDGDIDVEELFLKNEMIPVYSFNEETRKIEEDVITDMWVVYDKPLLKIITESGNIVEVPYEKECYTKSGWKKASDLTESDEILMFN